MVVKRPRSKPISLNPLIPGIERVQETVILGFTISDRIGFGTHMDKICCKARKSMFALRVLVAHGHHGHSGGATPGQARANALVKKLLPWSLPCHNAAGIFALP